MRGYTNLILRVSGISLLLLITDQSNAQSIAQIENIDFHREGPTMIITYDIVKAGTGEKFNVWVQIKTESGYEIKPVSIYGDVGKWVTGGTNKKIYWDLESDSVTLDEEISVEVFAQSEFEKPTEAEAEKQVLVTKAEYHRNVDIGAGFGLDYGGIIGVKIEFIPLSHLGIFASGGALLSGFGWQLGVIGYIIKKTNKRGFRPYGKFMFGTNASIYVMDMEELNKIYLGPSFGIGMEFRFGRAKKSGLNADLNFPIRSQDYKDDWDAIKNNPTLEIVSEPLPFTISVGYHFEF